MNLKEQHLAAWTDRRAGETLAFLSAPAVAQGATISTDGKCLCCRGQIIALESQTDRDWCWCPYCGTNQPAVTGSAGEIIKLA